jgi:hypothetical protein
MRRRLSRRFPLLTCRLGGQPDASRARRIPGGCPQPGKYSWTYFVSFPRSRFRAASTRATPIDGMAQWAAARWCRSGGEVRGEVPKETENESVDRVGSLMGDLDTIAWRKSDSSSSTRSWHSTTELLPLALLFFYLPVFKGLRPLYRESIPSIASIQNHGV